MQIFCNRELKIYKVKQMGQFVRNQKRKSANKVCCIRGSQKHNQEENPHTQEGRGASLSDMAPYLPGSLLHFIALALVLLLCSVASPKSLLPFPIHTATYLHPDHSLPGRENQPPPPILLQAIQYNIVCWEHFVVSSAFSGSISCFPKI